MILRYFLFLRELRRLLFRIKILYTDSSSFNLENLSLMRKELEGCGVKMSCSVCQAETS